MQNVRAAIDLGSNSFHLMIASIQQQKLSILKKVREPVRLAAAINADGHLSDEGACRALDCLSIFKHSLAQYSDCQARAVATAAFRRLKSPVDFVSQASNQLGVTIEVISGIEEAKTIFAGVCFARPLAANETRLVIDIGGGSTEVIVGSVETLHFIESFPVGCVTLQQKYYPDGYCDGQVLKLMQQEVDAILGPAKQKMQQLQWTSCLTSSGTAQAVGHLASGSLVRDSVGDLLAAYDDGQLPGCLAQVKPDRRLILPAGLTILMTLFEWFDVTTFSVSKAALREGILASAYP